MAAPTTYSGASYYSEIVISSTSVSADETIDVYLTLSFATAALTSADQIVITNSAGTAYKAVKENFSLAGQTCDVWAKIPVLSTANTTIYAQYGTGISYSSDTSLWTDIGIPTGTFANRYSMDDASGSYTGLDGDNLTVVNGTMNTTGKIGKAWTGATTTGYLYGATNDTLNAERTDALTIIQLFKNTSTGVYRFNVMKQLNSGAYNGTFFYLDTSNLMNFGRLAANGTAIQRIGSTAYNATANYVVGAVTSAGDSNSANIILYKDGAVDSSSSLANNLNATVINASNFVVGGRGIVGGAFSAYSYAIYDESRIYNVVKTAAYIKGWSNFVLSNATYITYAALAESASYSKNQAEYLRLNQFLYERDLEERISKWHTSLRPSAPLDGYLGYNNDLLRAEIYKSNTTSWVSLVPPGGSTTQVQFNDVGEFGGSSYLTFNKTTGLLTGTTLTLSGQFTSTVAGGTAPFVITSTTKVSNLNAEYWDSILKGTLSTGKLLRWDSGGAGGTLLSSSITESSGALSGITTLTTTGNVTCGTGTRHDGYVILDAAETSTSDATQTTVATLALLDENTYMVEAFVVGVKSTGADRCSAIIACTAYRTGAGSATLQGGVTAIHANYSDTSWNVTFTVSGNNLLVSVTGKAATTIQWGCTLKYINMSN